MWAEEYGASRTLLDGLVEIARRNSWPMLALTLDTLGGLEFRIGRWTAADAHSAEAVRLSETGPGSAFVLSSALTTLARIDAARGRESASRESLHRARELAAPGSLAAAYATSAAGLLELSLDRPDRVIAELEPLVMVAEPLFGPMVIQSAPDLIEAYVRSNRRVDAINALEQFEAQATASGRVWVQAEAARCRGMLALSRSADEPFREALALHDRTTTPFQRARTELCFGERLRRARRPDEATEHLRAAAVAFEALGAPTWAGRARRELAPHRSFRPRPAGPVELLSAHELQVTAFVRQGATNREIAGALFVSEKAVEYHLGNAYRKLAVRSRTELALLLERRSRSDG